MKKTFLAMLLVLCMCCNAALAIDDSTVLPDFETFAGDALTLCDRIETDDCIELRYQGAAADIAAIGAAYAQLLHDCGMLEETCHTPDNCVKYSYQYTGLAVMGDFTVCDDDNLWEISGAQVCLVYSCDDAEEGWLRLCYRPEFTCQDSGHHYGDDSTGHHLCSTCNGSGSVTSRCSSCGGSGHHSCSVCGGDGSRSCSSCGGDGTHTCSSCGGSGHHSSSHHDSHHSSSSSSCSSCGGSGSIKCSSCSGSGSLKCGTCHGSGSASCSSCSGQGSTSHTCTACNGTGYVAD
ncbi:MAG: hypothetical protein ACI4O7_08065 [Aristaeellaceae bacterium]